MNVLYVEDNTANARLLARFFKLHKRWHLAIATTAASGIAAARAQPPDLILMDLNLPDMSGVEALHALRAAPLTAAIPVVAVSADARPDHITSVLAAGFDAYVTKPVDLAALDATLARYAR